MAGWGDAKTGSAAVPVTARPARLGGRCREAGRPPQEALAGVFPSPAQPQPHPPTRLGKWMSQAHRRLRGGGGRGRGLSPSGMHAVWRCGEVGVLLPSGRRVIFLQSRDEALERRQSTSEFATGSRPAPPPPASHTSGVRSEGSHPRAGACHLFLPFAS